MTSRSARRRSRTPTRTPAWARRRGPRQGEDGDDHRHAQEGQVPLPVQRRRPREERHEGPHGHRRQAVRGGDEGVDAGAGSGRHLRRARRVRDARELPDNRADGRYFFQGVPSTIACGNSRSSRRTSGTTTTTSRSRESRRVRSVHGGVTATQNLFFGVGTYTYRCDVGDHASQGMIGSLRVT